jgi:hypothetical protein
MGNDVDSCARARHGLQEYWWPALVLKSRSRFIETESLQVSTQGILNRKSEDASRLAADEISATEGTGRTDWRMDDLECRTVDRQRVSGTMPLYILNCGFSNPASVQDP